MRVVMRVIITAIMTDDAVYAASHGCLLLMITPLDVAVCDDAAADDNDALMW